MAETYDNLDKGAAFKPFDTQKLILQGKVNNNGKDLKIVLIKDQTKAGKPLIEVFEKVGTLFVNEKKESEAAPDYTGPAWERRIAAWKRMKDGKPYMTFAVSDARDRDDAKPEPAKHRDDLDDDLAPF